jgi:hypothetical protein
MISLRAEPETIQRGEMSILTWSVERAEEVVLIEGVDFLDMLLGESDPMELFHSSEHVDPFGERSVLLDGTKEFHIMARNESGLSSASIIIDVIEGEVVPVEPNFWKDQPLERKEVESEVADVEPELEADIDVEYLEYDAPDLWDAKGATAAAASSPKVIFENENAKHSWSVSNADTASLGSYTKSVTLVPDLTQNSGTKRTGGSLGAGATPIWSPSGGTDSGTATVYGKMGSYGARWHTNYVKAYNSAGNADASAWVDVLSIPSFKGTYAKPDYAGASQTRKQAILTALKAIEKELRGGCIYNDGKLDATVVTFKSKSMKRKDVWMDIMLEMQNMRNITFEVKDVPASSGAGGAWGDYNNTIYLYWTTSSQPRLEYVILHELIHKVGFNSKLLGKYSVSQIETMAHAVTDSCFP